MACLWRLGDIHHSRRRFSAGSSAPLPNGMAWVGVSITDSAVFADPEKKAELYLLLIDTANVPKHGKFIAECVELTRHRV